MKNKNVEIITRHEEMACWGCEGKKKVKGKKCPVCVGTGIWVEKYYYVVDLKNKIAVGGDSIK